MICGCVLITLLLLFFRLVIPLQLLQTTQAPGLEEMLNDNVEIPGGNRGNRCRNDGPAKEESILRNERAKKLLSDQKKIADVCLFFCAISA